MNEPVLTKKIVKEAMAETFAEHGITPEAHISHHQFIELMMQKRENREKLFRKFESSLIGGLALAILGALGWIGSVVLDAIQAHWK